MAIQCSEINQTINQLLINFQDCKTVNPDDLRTLVELVAAVYNCEGEGANYNTINNDVYEPEVDEVVTYPVDSFHAISVTVAAGTIEYNGVALPTGSSINIEFTTTNQQAFTFTANAGSTVLVEYITETV